MHLYYVHPLPSLLAKLFPSPVFSANTLLHTVLWYKLNLLYVVQYCVTQQLYGHHVESMKFINLKARAVAHKQSEGATKGLKVYKFHRLHMVPV